MSGIWRLGGHLGPSVSALIDGQLDDATSERAWDHVMGCASCRRLVGREGWVKTQLAQMSGNEPSARLLGSLYELDPPEREAAHKAAQAAARDAWAAVAELETRSRTRRRAGLAVAGAGSVSLAVLGLSTLSGAPLGIGGGSAGQPASSLTRPSPTARPASATPSFGSSAWRSPFPGWLTNGAAEDGTRTVSVRPR